MVPSVSLTCAVFIVGRKSRIFRDNLDFFRSLDALMSQERHCWRLCTLYGLQDLRLVH